MEFNFTLLVLDAVEVEVVCTVTLKEITLPTIVTVYPISRMSLSLPTEVPVTVFIEPEISLQGMIES